MSQHDSGWFGKVGYNDIMAVANAPLKTNYRFEDMFICDPSAPHYGYKSWDGALFLPPFSVAGLMAN